MNLKVVLSTNLTRHPSHQTIIEQPESRHIEPNQGEQHEQLGQRFQIHNGDYKLEEFRRKLRML